MWGLLPLYRLIRRFPLKVSSNQKKFISRTIKASVKAIGTTNQRG